MCDMESRTYCMKAYRNIADSGELSHRSQCRKCRYILFVACPGFTPKKAGNDDLDVVKYLERKAL